jgi:transposase
MHPLIERGCGLDVHQQTVVATLLVGAADVKPKKTTRTFGTCCQDLLALRDWLKAQGCTHVGMESTGVYWKPVYAVLESEFEVFVGNARNIKAVPGRKTDVKDSEWLAELVRHGLIEKSFVPNPPQRALRELLRYRRKIVEEGAAQRNRLLKELETAGIKLGAVLTDVFGVSGRRMIEALIEGQATPAQMADLAAGSAQVKRPALERALEGKLPPWQRTLLRLQMQRIEQGEADLMELDRLIEEQLEPFRPQLQQLRTIPGVGRLTAATIIAEMGVEMTVFATAARAAAWAGVCPGNNESAGKRKSSRTRPGNRSLKTALVEAAQAGSRKKNSYYKAKYGQLRGRMNHKQAVVTIAHKILISAYHVLSGEPYKDLGSNYLDQLNPKRTTRKLVKRLEQMGYQVELTKVAA